MPASPKNLSRARELIESRFDEPLDVPTLASAVRLSPAHFSREFHRRYGESPHQYLLHRRMHAAAELLRSTDRGIAEICHAVGFHSVGSFTTTFTRTFGLPPGRYRAMGRAE